MRENEHSYSGGARQALAKHLLALVGSDAEQVAREREAAASGDASKRGNYSDIVFRTSEWVKWHSVVCLVDVTDGTQARGATTATWCFGPGRGAGVHHKERCVLKGVDGASTCGQCWIRLKPTPHIPLTLLLCQDEHPVR